MRPKELERTVGLVRSRFPHDILIADDSGPALAAVAEDRIRQHGGVSFLRMPNNSGLSAGRNLLVKKCPTRLFVLLDDDVVPHEGSIESMRTLMGKLGAALLAGTFPLQSVEPERQDFYGFFSWEGRVVANFFPNADEMPYFEEHAGLRYAGCRFAHNFFMGDRDVFLERRITWDPALKYREHLEFFLRFPMDLPIYMSPDIRADHSHNYDEGDYRGWRRANQAQSTLHFSTINGGHPEYLRRLRVDFDWRKNPWPWKPSRGRILI